MSNRRVKQVGSLVREQLAQLLLNEISDPMLRDIVVTEVEMSPDLKVAHIYYTQGAQSKPLKEKELDQGFKRASSFLRRRIGVELELRSVPELRFIMDKHGENLGRVLSLIDQVVGNPVIESGKELA